MISTKILLYKGKKKVDGTYPKVLRLIQDRKPKYIFLEYIDEKSLNSKTNKVKNSHPQSEKINNLIVNKLAFVDDLILDSKRKGEFIENSSKAFDSKAKKEEVDKEKSALYNKIGQLQVENDFFKKVLEK